MTEQQDRNEPTWINQLWHAERMPDSELRQHALVSLSNRHRCTDCFCCAALQVLEARHPQLTEGPIFGQAIRAERIIDAMEGN